MEASHVQAGPKLGRFAQVEIPRLFQMAGWALVVGLAKYLGHRFALEPLHLASLVLSALMLGYAFAERRSVAGVIFGVLINMALIALAWETASVVASLQATVTI